MQELPWVSTDIWALLWKVLAWAGPLSQGRISANLPGSCCEVEVGWWSPSSAVSDWHKTGSFLSTKQCPSLGTSAALHTLGTDLTWVCWGGEVRTDLRAHLANFWRR